MSIFDETPEVLSRETGRVGNPGNGNLLVSESTPGTRIVFGS